MVRRMAVHFLILKKILSVNISRLIWKILDFEHCIVSSELECARLVFGCSFSLQCTAFDKIIYLQKSVHCLRWLWSHFHKGSYELQFEKFYAIFVHNANLCWIMKSSSVVQMPFQNILLNRPLLQISRFILVMNWINLYLV